MSNIDDRRIGKLSPSELDDTQQALYQAIARGPRAQGTQLFKLVDEEGCLEGPFNAFLLQPELGLPLQELGSAVRYRTTLSDRAREIAILVVAEVQDSEFERYAHEAVGRHMGLADREIGALRSRSFDVFDAVEERVVAESTYALCTRGDLDDDEYRAAVGALGLDGVFEVLTLVGYYNTLALQLRVFRVGAPTA